MGSPNDLDMQMHPIITVESIPTSEPVSLLRLWRTASVRSHTTVTEPITAGTEAPMNRSLLVQDVPGKTWEQKHTILVLDMLEMCRVHPDVLIVPFVVLVPRLMEKF